MLICRRGQWRVESDGYVSCSGTCGTRRFARSRSVPRAGGRTRGCPPRRPRARTKAPRVAPWIRGGPPGRTARIRRAAGRPHRSRRVAWKSVLSGLALNAIVAMLGELPADVALAEPAAALHCTRRGHNMCISLRVSADDYEQAKRACARPRAGTDTPLFMVLADAGLPPHSSLSRPSTA